MFGFTEIDRDREEGRTLLVMQISSLLPTPHFPVFRLETLHGQGGGVAKSSDFGALYTMLCNYHLWEGCGVESPIQTFTWDKMQLPRYSTNPPIYRGAVHG